MAFDVDALVAFAWRATLVATIISGIGLIAQRVGPSIASIIVGMPAMIGPTLLLLALEHDAAFIRTSAFFGFVCTVPVLMYLTAFVYALKLFGFWLSITYAYYTWVVFTLVMRELPLTLPVTLLAVAITYPIVHWLMVLAKTPIKRTSRPVSYGFLILRGVIAGILISLLVLSSNYLGPALAGLLAGFPLILGATTWMLNSIGGPQLVASTVSSIHKGLFSYAAFCLSTHLFAGPFQSVSAVLLGLLTSAIVSFGIYAWVHRRDQSVPLRRPA